MKYLLLITFLSIVNLTLRGQEEIKILNQSFENEKAEIYPRTWPPEWDGLQDNTEQNTPDVHKPNELTLFQVKQKAIKGNKYLGLVTRTNNKNEGISQKLTSPLIADTEYSISFIASSSRTYISPGYTEEKAGKLITHDEDMNYNNSVRLVLLGKRNNELDNDVLLGWTEPIEFDEWKEYKIEFPVFAEFTGIIIKVEPVNFEVKKQMRGNVLIDYISNIKVKG